MATCPQRQAYLVFSYLLAREVSLSLLPPQDLRRQSNSIVLLKPFMNHTNKLNKNADLQKWLPWCLSQFNVALLRNYVHIIYIFLILMLPVSI